MPEATARIGAAADNDLVLRFPGVSRYHAKIEVHSVGVRLVDVGSKNGLIVAGKRLTEVVLRLGEAVGLGRAVLRIEDSRTSDVHLAFETGVRHSSGVAGATPPEEYGDGAGAALRMIRELEAGGPRFSGRRRQQALQRAMSVLAASTLALCNAGPHTETNVSCIAGRLPQSDLVEFGACAFSSVVRTWRTLVERRGPVTAIFSGRASHFLMAVLNGSGAPWAEDFVGFMAEKLIGLPASQQEQRDEHATVCWPEQLEIPKGMVLATSEPMRRLLQQIAATVAPSQMDVLLLGETGTGKELFARMIHASGPTRKGPFAAVNCAAIPADLLEAELFGVHGRVATGVDPRPGLFTQTDGGSILLDEIGELPERLQAKLLRVLQEREVLPLGASRPRRVNVRVISASNRDLEARVAEGQFRADLYYRIRGLQFHIPPLRQRKDDIPALVVEFVTRGAEASRKTILGVSRSALAILVEHDWPGNVRELEGEIGRAVLVCPSGGAIQAEHLGTVRWLVEKKRTSTRHGEDHSEEIVNEPPNGTSQSWTLKQRVEVLEREQIARAMGVAGGNQSRAANLLGLTRNGLALKLKRYGIGGRPGPTGEAGRRSKA